MESLDDIRKLIANLEKAQKDCESINERAHNLCCKVAFALWGDWGTWGLPLLKIPDHFGPDWDVYVSFRGDKIVCTVADEDAQISNHRLPLRWLLPEHQAEIVEVINRIKAIRADRKVKAEQRRMEHFDRRKALSTGQDFEKNRKLYLVPH